MELKTIRPQIRNTYFIANMPPVTQDIYPYDAVYHIDAARGFIYQKLYGQWAQTYFDFNEDKVAAFIKNIMGC